MSKFLRRLFSGLVLLVAGISYQAGATHLYGGDLYYTYVSGNTYKVTLVLYGNCAGSSFNTLINSTAQVVVYNGTSSITSLTLTQSPANPPTEVTPVCPAQANQTPCVLAGSTNPGVKRFTYTANYNVPSASANWRFRFNGSVNGTAGRSLNITNIVSGTTMSLEATLNNTVAPNSSPIYTTIPTPFFCINKPASYNPGSIDPDGDSLVFTLVPGILPTSGTVTYQGGYTATNPLAATPGTFVFSANNGQLDFTPNALQFSLVVYQVSEYRNGILVGTSMREMTFVVQTCNNNPPGGSVTLPAGSSATVINNTSVSVCQRAGLFSYNVNPTDADGNNINVTATGLPTGATFNITGNNTTTPLCVFSWDVTNVTPGVYTYFLTFLDDGCPLASKQTLAYTVVVLPSPSMTFNIVRPATCNSKAVFEVTPSGASGPYTVNMGTITRSNVSGTITDSLAPGTYTFRVTATNSCSFDTSITIASPATTLISAAIRQNTCNATSSGQVTLTGSNSVNPPYTYAQGAGTYSSVNTFGGLAAGSYVFHVKDQAGCIKDTTLLMTDSLTAHGLVTVSNVLCNGGSTGSIQIAGYGAVSPYRYALGAGTFGAANTFPGLAAGTYALHIKDTLGCFNDTTATVTQPAVLGLSATATNVSCNGLSDGAVTLAGTGGTPGYTFAVGSGAYSASATISGLAAGTYTFHVKDNNACIKDTILTITQPAALAFTLAVTNVLCNGGSTGTVTVNAAGGTPSYTYAADANTYGAANVLTGLNAGSHAIHLKDNNGCRKDSTLTITQPAVLGIAFTAANPLCNGASNGTITIAGSGGTTPYSYALDSNPFVAGGAMTGLAAGTYAVHIKDANGCTHDTTATLVAPTALTVSVSIVRPRCTPLVNGSVTLAAANGTPGYTYARGTSAYVASPVFSGLGSGTYTFHVKDNNGCIKDTTLTLTDSIAVHATTVISLTKCFGSTDGSIAITPSGGDAPYTFAVNAGAYSATNPIVNLAANTYVLHIKDANGCILDTSQTVGQPTIVVPGAVITQPLCFQGSDGAITMSATGGTPGYTYALGSGAYAATPLFGSLTAGTYTLHVKDLNGCVRDTTLTVGQPAELKFGFTTLTHLVCNGDNSGTITLRATGGTPSYTFAADAGAFQAAGLLTGLAAGVHAIHIKDANGCTRDSSVRLFEPTKAHVKIDTIINPTCETYKDGSVTISAFGGTPGYTFSPDNVTFDTQRHYYLLPEGHYSFYAKDSRGCPADTSVDLTGYPHIRIDRITVTDARCNGFSDGRFTLSVSGGNAPLTYYMVRPADTSRNGTFDSLKMGIYTVRIVDSTGCFRDTAVKVNHPDTLIAQTLVTPNDCIGYDDGGAVDVVVAGGTAPYAYLWSTNPPQTGSRISGLGNGRYSVMVTDAHNCSDTTSAVVPYDNCCTPYIVNAFTPNGDGKNDKFRVLFKGDVKLEQFSVFNRYGQRVFYTTLTDVGWDGTWNDKPQDMGTYFYYIRLVCGNKGDNIQEFKGDVTLLR